MILTTKESIFINKVYVKLRENLDLLKENNIEKCEICNGSGLKGKIMEDGNGFSWNGEFCDKCKGIGYNPIEDVVETINDLFGEFRCSHCNGLGCKLCDNKGFVDWIRYACGG